MSLQEKQIDNICIDFNPLQFVEYKMEDALCKEVCVRNKMGLHARPAAMLAKEAAKFDSEIILALDNNEVDAKSVLDILSLAAGQGSELQIKASGMDAPDALEHLEKLFQSGFEEE
jgi:phosphocarrier protein